MKKNYDIEGMHCRSCEVLIEAHLGQIPGVKKATANSTKGVITIESDDPIADETVRQSLKETDYKLVKKKQLDAPKSEYDYKNLLIAIVVFGVLLVIGYQTDLINIFSVQPEIGSSLVAIFFVGLAAGFSTCMAVVGGLVLGLSSKYSNQHPDLSPVKKIKPQLVFNLGRIIFFTLLGGILGLGGSILQLSGFSLGIITLILGVYLFFLGVKLIGIFPNLIDRLTLPKVFSKKLKVNEKSRQSYTNANAFFLGGLTFFLPCGFTQAVQVFAISSGRFTTGAVMMGVFALGTTPGLITIGSLSAFIKEGNFSKVFFKTVGLLLIFLAWVNLSHGLVLSGISMPKIDLGSPEAKTEDQQQTVPVEAGKQIVEMEQGSDGYKPNHFVLKQGVPVKWVITANDIGSCSSFITIPDLNIKKFLDQKENIIEFTPTKIGKLTFSCSMGMYTGSFEVIP